MNGRKQPNFLILFTDQQRYDTIGAAGYSHMKTPNLDRLATQGCLFRNAYSPNPVCVPARYCLLTGTTGRYHGFHDNGGSYIKDDGLPTIPRVLSDNGYFTAAIGKMHFRPTRRHNGFLEMHLMEEIPHHLEDDAYAQYLRQQGYGDIRCLHGVRPFIYHYPQQSLMPEEHHGSAWVAGRTIEVMERNKDRPFFIMSGWIKPHPPWNIPEGWQGLYRNSDLPEPIPISREAPYSEGESPWFGDHDSPEEKRAIREAYFTSISMLDHYIGQILDYLEQNQLLDNTFIIFTSDHGEMLQDKGLYQKAVPFESASHIPFIIRYPDLLKPGSEDKRFVDLMDIFPTILDVANIDLHSKDCRRDYELAGESLLKEETGHRDRSYQRCGLRSGKQRWVMIRDERCKYIYHYGGGLEHFYDLESDPQEMINLVRTGGVHQDSYARLKTRCIELEERWGPAGHVENGQFVRFEETQRIGGDKYPLWANDQMPVFGDKSPVEEARLLVEQTKQAVAHHNDPDYLRKVAPEPQWIEHWWQNLRRRGGTEEMREMLFDNMESDE